MKKKLEILAIIVLVIIVAYASFGVVKNLLAIVLSKIALVAFIVAMFVLMKKSLNKLYGYLLIVAMLVGFFVFHMISNILFLLTSILMYIIIKKINLRKVGPIQIALIIFVILYLYYFGPLQTLSKLMSVILLTVLFLKIIWKEIAIYFTPVNRMTNEIDFIDQNIRDKNNRINQLFSRFINTELMTRPIAINLVFVFYMLLVSIDLVANLILNLIQFN